MIEREQEGPSSFSSFLRIFIFRAMQMKDEVLHSNLGVEFACNLGVYGISELSTHSSVT